MAHKQPEEVNGKRQHHDKNSSYNPQMMIAKGLFDNYIGSSTLSLLRVRKNKPSKSSYLNL